MQRELTLKQKIFFRIFREFIRTKGYGPSVQEMTDMMSFRSTNATRKYMRAILALGYAEFRKPHSWRLMKITEKGEQFA